VKTPEEIARFVQSDRYIRHQTAAGELLARAILSPDANALQAGLDVYVESQAELAEILRGEPSDNKTGKAP